MPKKRLSKMRAMRELEGACTNQAEAIYNSTVGKELKARGYELQGRPNGRLGNSESDQIREKPLNGEVVWICHSYSDWGVDGIADCVIWHQEKCACALIGTTLSAIVQVLDKSIMPEMKKFAEAWEKERPALRAKLNAKFQRHLHSLDITSAEFDESVTMI